AIPETLLEYELFGQERGAYPVAMERRIGAFERSRGGTILLDEVGDLSPALQARILRVLRGRSLDGAGTADSPGHARVLATTHRDLERSVAEGRFREDLYQRLHVVAI